MLSEGVRIMFAKTGKLKYISHLDLCRTFRSAFKRARIPIWYSQGFNPHPKMVFATTVSVGQESLCELLDIRITSPMSEEEFVSRLQNALTSEIHIIKAYEPCGKFTDLAYAKYEITLENELSEGELEEVLSKPIIITKMTKKGEKTEDIVPLVKSASVNKNVITCILSAVQNEFLNPDNFVKGLSVALGRELEVTKVLRTQVYYSNLEIFE